LREYLDRLEEIVNAAEAQFAPPGDDEKGDSDERANDRNPGRTAGPGGAGDERKKRYIMKPVIFLVRHGLIDYSKKELNSEGLRFSQNLVSILGDKGIETIVCDEKQWCKDTVAPLAARLSIPVKSYSKEKFRTETPVAEASKSSCALICYRVESMDCIQEQLGVDILREENRDEGYEFIYQLTPDSSGRYRVESIPTGFRKTDV
jgi:hypothetical protein